MDNIFYSWWIFNMHVKELHIPGTRRTRWRHTHQRNMLRRIWLRRRELRRRVCQRRVAAASGASSMIRLGAVPEHMCRRLAQPSRRRVVAPPAPRCGGAGASSIIHRADIIKVCVLISIMSHLRSRQLIFPSTNRWGAAGCISN